MSQFVWDTLMPMLLARLGGRSLTQVLAGSLYIQGENEEDEQEDD